MAVVPMEKIKPLLILTGILALLLVLLLVTGGADKEEERTFDSLITFEPESISSLSIKNGSLPEMLFSRTDGPWVMREPLYSLASRETMNAILETLDKLVGIPLDIDRGSDLTEFGLQGTDTITISVVNKQGKQESFSLGNPIPLDVGYVYTYVPSSGEFYKAYKDARNVFNLPLEDFRDTTVVDAAISNIASIAISGTLTDNPEPVVVEKQPPWWEISAPAAAPGNNRKVKELLEGILSLRAVDFPEPMEGIEKKNPELKIRFSSAEGGGETVSFYSDYGNDLQYVISDRIPYALGIPRGLIDNLPIRFDELRSRTILRFDPSVIQEISIESGSQKIGLLKEEGEWHFSTAKDVPVDTAAVEHVISLLTLRDVEDLSAARNLSRNETSIQLRVLLREQDGDEHSVELGEADKGDILAGFSSFRDRPFVVPPGFFDSLQIDADFFEDRHLLSFESRDVGAVEIRGNGKNITLTKSGSDWLLTKPERGAADSPKSWGLVFALEKLVYDEKISPAEFDLNNLSPDTRDFSILVLDSDGKDLGKLDLWIATGEQEAIAASSLREGFFLIDRQLLDRIPADHTELLYRR